MKASLLAAMLVTGLALAGEVQAAYTFDTAGTCTGCGTNGNSATDDNSRAYTGVTVTAWANTGGNFAQDSASGSIQQAYLSTWGSSGLGMKNDDAYSSGSDKDVTEGSSPEHAIDNDGRYDMVLFDFGSSLVKLTSITIGWSSIGADFSVLAFTGSGTPNLSAASSWGSLTSNGWTVVGNYGTAAQGNTDITVAINSAQKSSSYWLVGAYNPIFASSALQTVGNPDSGCSRYSSTYWDTTRRLTCKNTTSSPNNNDYFKLAAVSGSLVTPPPPPPPSSKTPEPTSLALAGLALVGLVRSRRRLM